MESYCYFGLLRIKLWLDLFRSTFECIIAKNVEKLNKNLTKMHLKAKSAKHRSSLKQPNLTAILMIKELYDI